MYRDQRTPSPKDPLPSHFKNDLDINSIEITAVGGGRCWKCSYDCLPISTALVDTKVVLYVCTRHVSYTDAPDHSTGLPPDPVLMRLLGEQGCYLYLAGSPWSSVLPRPLFKHSQDSTNCNTFKVPLSRQPTMDRCTCWKIIPCGNKNPFLQSGFKFCLCYLITVRH